MLKRGLTLGKYAPLHYGHQLVIDTALAEMDEVVVIVYDSPATTSTPLPMRSGWIRALYPSVRIIEAWNGPMEVGYTPELMRLHEHYVLDLLGVHGITHFYSSEPYGIHMSKALGAVDRRVDDARLKVPVSASDVRRDPFAQRRFLPPLVYRDLVINAAILGAPCTGKSTIAQRLAEVFETRWMPEYGREYWTEHQVARRLTPEQLVEIAEGHLDRENMLLEQANRFLFTDTNAITTATFARHYHGVVSPRLAELADRAVGRYDLVFVCDTDLPYDDTWDRSGEVDRVAFQRQVLGDLAVRRVPYFMLQGTIEERVARVRGILSQFHKYMNLMDLHRAVG